MAFNLVRGKNGPDAKKNLVSNASQSHLASGCPIPKLTNAQLSKLAKTYPNWLRDSSSIKLLPGVYHGVLGQVQLQPEFANLTDKACSTRDLVKKQQQIDYLNRFTDTQRVHQLLSASRLSNETLAAIWAHVNKIFPGQLTNREVCLALAIIAIFQRFEKENKEVKIGQKDDPFNLVSLEKKPPVPILYPNNIEKKHLSPTKSSFIKTSRTVPNNLSSSDLLIDISIDNEIKDHDYQAKHSSSQSKSQAQLFWNFKDGQTISLIDLDVDKFEISLSKIIQIWFRMMTTMRAIFKRAFDILNVDHSRQSSLEALGSPEGQMFGKNLCLCYPVAHNIKFKIEGLNERTNLNQNGRRLQLFDKNFVSQINDLMISINEYWAVLINLLNESGLTAFIELIMDGLNNETKKTFIDGSMGGLDNELDGSNKPNTCSICYTGFYLTSTSTLRDHSSLTENDFNLVTDQELISQDGCYFYHAKCANFWLNHVELTGTLPFKKECDEEILIPSTI